MLSQLLLSIEVFLSEATGWYFLEGLISIRCEYHPASQLGWSTSREALADPVIKSTDLLITAMGTSSAISGSA
jgi:hypothetical protein